MEKIRWRREKKLKLQQSHMGQHYDVYYKDNETRGIDKSHRAQDLI